MRKRTNTPERRNSGGRGGAGLSKDLKRFRSLLTDQARASLYAVTILTEMAYEETRDLLAACERMKVSAPVLFLNLATPESECPLCSALRCRESRVEEKPRDVFPAAHHALVYRGGDLRASDSMGWAGRCTGLGERDGGAIN